MYLYIMFIQPTLGVSANPGVLGSFPDTFAQWSGFDRLSIPLPEESLIPWLMEPGGLVSHS